MVLQRGTCNWSHIADTLRYATRLEAEKENLTFFQENNRTGKQCRERWYNQLDPELTKEPFSKSENACIVYWQSRIGKEIHLA